MKPSLRLCPLVQIIDPDFRIFIVEGHAEGAMVALAKEFVKSQNTDELTILRNRNLRFRSRLYLQDDVEFKRVKVGSVAMQPGAR